MTSAHLWALAGIGWLALGWLLKSEHETGYRRKVANDSELSSYPRWVATVAIWITCLTVGPFMACWFAVKGLARGFLGKQAP